MITALKNLLKKPFKPVAKPTRGFIWDYTTSFWGHTLSTDQKENGVLEAIGHGSAFPPVNDTDAFPFLMNWYTMIDGDFVMFKMKSGKIAKYRLENVSYFKDPRDMLTARLIPVSYCDEKGNDIPCTPSD